uniref:toxic anion resistance protein n=1 Tax=Stenotrophomonas muris TaxID=2963283 RepID=UPI00300E6E6F
NQQFSIAMALKKQALTTGIVKDVSDMTGKLAVENSKMLKQNAINVATEAEKPFIEIEKLVEANENIKTAIKEVIDIQRKGEEKRRMSIKELEQVEQNFGQLDDNNEGLNRLTNNTASTLKSNNFISNQNTNEAIANYVKSNKK